MAAEDIAPALAPPAGINPNAIEHWFTACQNLTSTDRSSRLQATQLFVDACKAYDLSPFLDDNPNPAIRHFLAKRRRLYVRYLERTGLMENVYVRKIQQREAYLTEYGFGIRIEAWCNVPDPYWFRKIRATPGWRFSLTWDDEHRCNVHLDPGITVYVRNPSIRSPITWYVGYEIHCPLTPKLKVLDSQTILRTLWDPISLTIRPKGTLPQRRI